MRKVLHEAEILTLATHPAKRRQGLGRKALAASADWAKTQGVTKIFLEVAEDNTAAIALYSTAGYTQIGRRPGYYLPKDRAAIDALILAQSLPAT